jgi:type IV secretory pathway VirB10-like protein
MDKLKQYLQEHRDAMDVEIPPADLLQHIQAGTVAHAGKAVLAKYVIYIMAIGVLAVSGTAAWLMIHKQKATPAPVAPSKKVMPTDTVPIQKDTMPVSPVQPVIKHKKIHKVPPATPVIHKHKKVVDTTEHQPKPRSKKKVEPADQPIKPRPKKKARVPIT